MQEILLKLDEFELKMDEFEKVVSHFKWMLYVNDLVVADLMERRTGRNMEELWRKWEGR
jgi:hypothetical protein